jgi:hypothetical protein
VLAAVQEQIALAGMAVNVYKEVDLSALESFTDHLLHGVDLSAQFGVRILPLPIQVEPCQTASVVSHYNSVRVKHRDYFEHKSVSKNFGFSFVTDDKLKKAFHYEASIRLPRVNSTADNYALPFSDGVLTRCEISNYEHFTCVACFRLTKVCPSQSVFSV